MDPALCHVPVDRGWQVPGPEVVEGETLGRVALAQVVHERPHVAGVAGRQGFEGTARAYGAELAEISDGHQLRPRGFHGSEEFPHIGVGGHGPLVENQHVARAEGQAVVLEAPGEGGDGGGADASPFAQRLGRLARRGGTEHDRSRKDEAWGPCLLTLRGDGLRH